VNAYLVSRSLTNVRTSTDGDRCQHVNHKLLLLESCVCFASQCARFRQLLLPVRSPNIHPFVR
jgi:hypothetical protein